MMENTISEIQICLSPIDVAVTRIAAGLNPAIDVVTKDIEALITECAPEYKRLPTKNPYYVHYGLKKGKKSENIYLLQEKLLIENVLSLRGAVAGFDIVYSGLELRSEDVLQDTKEIHEATIQALADKAFGDPDEKQREAAKAYLDELYAEYDAHPFLDEDSKDKLFHTFDFL